LMAQAQPLMVHAQPVGGVVMMQPTVVMHQGGGGSLLFPRYPCAMTCGRWVTS
jgi:hypothetical protein